MTLQILSLLALVFELAGVLLILVWSEKGYGIARITQAWEREHIVLSPQEINVKRFLEFGIITILTGFAIELEIRVLALQV